jgi:uncharacterized protein
MCTLAGRCIGTIYAVEPNGDITHCDYFLGDPLYRWGNIMGQDFADIRRSLNMATVREARARSLDRMRECPHLSICQGGCPHEDYASFRHNPEHTANCCGMARLLDHIRARTARPARV